MTKPRLIRSAGVVSLGTLASRLLGMAREMMMAAVFGTHLAGSAFVVAFTIPNLFRRLFGEGALSAAFIPTYVKTRDGEGQPQAWALTRNIGSLIVHALGPITLLGMLASTFWLQAPGLPAKTEAVLLSMRIMLPYMIGICLAALAMGVLNSHRRYAVSAFTPCVLNLVWIAALAWMARHPGLRPEEMVIVLAWTILAAGVLQFAVQLPSLRRLGMRWAGPVDLRGPGVRRVVLLMGPAALGAAVTQINVLIDRLLAFWVADYGPLALSYAERLIYLPLGLFATALGTVLLPELSALAHRRDGAEVGRAVDHGLRTLLFLMIPAAVGLGFLAEPVVRLIYERGEFGESSVLYTTRALACYAPGLVVFSIAKVFVPVFYAHGDTRTPVKIGALAVLGNIVLNLILIVVLPDGWKHAGLALGTVVSELAQVTALGYLLTRRYAKPPWRHIAVATGKQGLACLPMLAVAFGVLRAMGGFPLAAAVPAAILAALAAYVAAAQALGCRELRNLLRH